MSKRAPSGSQAAKPPTSLAPTITIADTASLTGTHLITIGSDTVIHPRTKLVSTFGPVTAGSSCILSERSCLGLQSKSEAQKDGVIIEDFVVLDVGAVVEATRVGEGTVVEVNARVGKGAVVGKHCKIGPLCVVAENEVLPDYTVIYGDGRRRVDGSGVDELNVRMIRSQVDALKRLIPSNVAKFK